MFIFMIVLYNYVRQSCTGFQCRPLMPGTSVAVLVGVPGKLYVSENFLELSRLLRSLFYRVTGLAVQTIFDTNFNCGVI